MASTSPSLSQSMEVHNLIEQAHTYEEDRLEKVMTFVAP